MNRTENTFLTTSQFTLTLKSVIVGIEIMNLPNDIIKFAKQDSWICCILGAIYPIYIVIIANYMCRKFPKENILILSKKYLGRFIGGILNFVFIGFFLFMLTSEVAGYINLFRIYAAPALKTYQILIPTLIPIAYVSYQGMKPLGRLNETVFYITIPLVILPAAILAYGSILNLKPVFGSGAINIFNGTRHTIYAFSGMEFIFLIYPFLQDNKKLAKCGMISIAIITAIYTWAVFSDIYYLGIRTSVKYFWPILTLTDSISIPIINSFRFIFISLWSLVQFKCTACYYFGVSYGLSQSIKKISGKKFTVMLFPVVILISILYGNPTTFFYYTNILSNIYIPFNLIYITMIAVLIYLKKGDSYAKA